MKISIYFDIMQKDGKNDDDYVICIFKNIRHIFNSKTNEVYEEYRNKNSKIGILKI
jgi:hypothetical protein